MSTLSDAMKGIKQLLLLQEQVRRLEMTGEKQATALDSLTDTIIALDKRVVRIETMIEMTARMTPKPPQIER